MRIRTKLAIGLGLLLLLYGLATLVFLNTLQSGYRQTLEDHATLLSSQIKSRIDAVILSYRDQLTLVSQAPRVSRLLSGELSGAESAELAEWLERNFIDYTELRYGSSLFDSVQVFGPSGERLLSTSARSYGPATEQSWWNRALDSGFSVEQMPSESSPDAVNLRLSVRVSGPDGVVRGAISGILDFLVLVRNAEFESRPFETTVLTVVSDVGRLLYQSTPFVLYRDVSTTELFTSMSGDSGVFTTDESGVSRLHAYATLGTGVSGFSRPWRFIVSYSLEEALAGMDAARRQLLIFLGLLFALAMGITLWVYRALQRPLNHLTQAVERLGSRDLDFRPPVPGRDEISMVIRRFDLMREKLQYFYNDMAQVAEEERRQREEAEAIAGTDELTRLFNRRAFFQFLGHRIEDARSVEGRLAVVFFDLNGFKPINDTYGHVLGDQVLRSVGRRLVSTTREGDFAARVGGDEFAVVFSRVEDAEGAMEAAERLVQRVAEPFREDDWDLRIGVSGGIALYPEHGKSAETLFEKADQAMYRAKASLGSQRSGNDSALRLCE